MQKAAAEKPAPQLETLDLGSMVDTDVWSLINESLDGYMNFYYHKKTYRPMVICKGGSRQDPKFVGIILFYRPSNSRGPVVSSVKAECSLSQAPIMIAFIADTYNKTAALDKTAICATWCRFTQAVVGDLLPRAFSRQQQASETVNPTPLSSSSPTSTSSSDAVMVGDDDDESGPLDHSGPFGLHDKQEDEDRSCVICMDREADTTTSCGHTVVCKPCSDVLATRSKDMAHRCVVCRQKLEAVFEPDGNVRIIDAGSDGDD